MCDSSSIIDYDLTVRNEHPLLLREAYADENNSLLDVIISSFIEFSTVLPEEGWRDYELNIADAVFKSPIARRIVAVYKNQIIGSVFLYRNGLDAYGNDDLQINSPVIRLLAVSPSARGLGVGKKLIEHCINIVRQQGATELYLHTSDMMSHAISIYERLGFERAFDKEFAKGPVLVKSYKFSLT